MICIVDTREEPGTDRKVAGLSLLLRAILVAQGAGAEAVVLLQNPGGTPPEKVARDPRVRIEVRTATGAEHLADLAGPALCWPVARVFDPRLLAKLRDLSAEDPEDAVAVNTSGDLLGLRVVRSPAAALVDPGASARSVCVGDLFSGTVSDGRSRRVAERGLLRGLIKPTDGFVSRHLNRKISLWITRWVVKTPVTPNQISLLTMGVSFLAACWIGLGDYASVLLGALVFQFASILDGTDGEVAKVTYRTSPRGEIVDTVADDVSYVAFVVAIIAGTFHRYDEPWVLTVGAGAALLLVISILAMHRFLRHAGTRSQVAVVTAVKEKGDSEHAGVLQWLNARMSFALRRDFFAALFLVAALLDGLVAMYWAFVFGMGWFAIVALGLAIRSSR